MRAPLKPAALRPGGVICIVSPASPPEESRLKRGMNELARVGYGSALGSSALECDGYFAGPAETRHATLASALADGNYAAVFCARGGYGSNYLVESLDPNRFAQPKILLGHSDITSLDVFLWQQLGWVTFYGPMVAAGFDAGADAPGGYDSSSFQRAVTATKTGWSLPLHGEALVEGQAEGLVLGGCLTVVETTLATPWELDTEGAILLLEDRGMKPYQVDRALMHLKQAGKFAGVRGIVLGEFPESNPPEGSQVTVKDVCRRILGGLGVPVVWGAAVGHTSRPMLTVPLGAGARLEARGAGRLEILEPAVTP